MATIRAYTTIEQSRKLAEILPLESADMVYTITNGYHTPWVRIEKIGELDKDDVCAWSLAALLDVASTYCSRLEITLRADKKYNVFAVKDDFVFRSFDDHPDGFDNPVDACVAMIERLHELNLL